MGGTLTLTSLAGSITCHSVSGGFVENPAGGRAGEGKTTTGPPTSTNAYSRNAKRREQKNTCHSEARSAR